MYFEQVATLTRDHARTHLRAYLDLVNAQAARKIDLPMPKHFDVSSILGGVVGIERSTLPVFAIDAFNKTLATDDDNVWKFLYNGQISGMVAADTAEMAETLSRRYAAACEMFVNAHRRSPLAAGYDPSGDPFRISGFGFATNELFGAANVPEGEQSIWVDGFRIDLAWEVIEEGPGQHG